MILLSKNLDEEFDLDSFLFPSSFSLDEERNSSLAVSEYKLHHEQVHIDLSLYTNTLKLNIDELIQHDAVSFTKISKDDLFDLLNSKTLVTNPTLPFPKIKHINELFWFLSNLSMLILPDTKYSYDKTTYEEKLLIVESAIFFGFLNYIDRPNGYLIPTPLFYSFKSLSTEEQYIFFLETVGSNKTTRDCINIQLSDPIYDKLSRQMIFNKLRENHNIIEEKLSSKDISNIVNNVRYWFLDIRKYLI